MSLKKALINDEIPSDRVILIDKDGDKKGEFLKNDAVSLAKEQGLDLVLVGQTSKYPICRIMDYGKILYKQKKNKNNLRKTKLKEIKFNLVSDNSYLDIKSKQARGFLQRGDQVKVSVKIKGREYSKVDMIIEKCIGFFQTLDDVAEIISPPKKSSNQVTMIISPKKS